MPKSEHLIEKARWQCKRFLRSWRGHREHLLLKLLISILALACPPATATPDPQIATPRLAVDNDIASEGIFRLSLETGAAQGGRTGLAGYKFTHRTENVNIIT
jgi:hypothetical protein